MELQIGKVYVTRNGSLVAPYKIDSKYEFVICTVIKSTGSAWEEGHAIHYRKDLTLAGNFRKSTREPWMIVKEHGCQQSAQQSVFSTECRTAMKNAYYATDTALDFLPAPDSWEDNKAVDVVFDKVEMARALLDEAYVIMDRN